MKSFPPSPPPVLTSWSPVEPSPVEPMAPLVADAVIELELTVLEDFAVRLDADATRVVEATRAEDMLLEPVDEEPLLALEDEAFEVTVTVVMSVDAVVELSRPNWDRLPRNCGVSRDAKFSAAVTPVRRIVASIDPAVAAAVRVAVAAATVCCPVFRRASSQ